jgi:hypothetical protein
MADSFTNLPELGATGLVHNLYEYLWMKNNLLQTRCMYHKCPPVLVPDTVLLQNKQPVWWYFSSHKTGTLQRRSKELSIDRVTEAIVRRQDPGTDIVAVYVGAAQGDIQPITEYLTPAGMEYFLSTPPSRRTKQGLLQSFIVPKGTSNFTIRVSWTPEECTMDSCININKLADPELDAQDRAATNDDKNCVLIPMAGNVLSTQLERLCGCITEHIYLASGQQFKVMSMVLNFKIDAEDRVWLLWCEQMEVGDDAGRTIQGARADARLLEAASDEDDPSKTTRPAHKRSSDKQDRQGTPKAGERRVRPEQGQSMSTTRTSKKSHKKDKFAAPEVVDSEEDDFFSAHESNLDEGSTRGRSRGGVLDDDFDEEQDENTYGTNTRRPLSNGSDASMLDDMILLPEGTKRHMASKERRTVSRKGEGRGGAQDSTPRSDASGESSAPLSSSGMDDAAAMRKKTGVKDKDDKRAAERQRELRRCVPCAVCAHAWLHPLFVVVWTGLPGSICFYGVC